MKLAQIIDNKAHWIFDPKERFGTTDLRDRFPADVIFVEVGEGIQEGYIYDAATGQFSKPEPEEYIPLEVQLTPQEKIINMLEQQQKSELDKDEIMIEQLTAAEEIKLALENRTNFRVGGVTD